MSWQDQGGQKHGWFGHGTSGEVAYDGSIADESLQQRSLSVAYGALAVLPSAQRRRLEAQYHYGTLSKFIEMITALMRGARLDRYSFASLFFDRAADSPVVQALHGAALAADLATSHAEMHEASESVAKAIDLVGIDEWPRFVTQIQARAGDPATITAVDQSRRSDPSRNDAIRPVYPLETAIGIFAVGVASGVGSAVRAGVGAMLRQGLPGGKPSLNGISVATDTSTADTTAASAASVRDKLSRYTLNLEHPVGGSKAQWFEQALGFTRQDMDELTRQTLFNEKTAVQTEITKQGTKFKQTIDVTGANGRTIPVITAWIKGEDGVARLITVIPGK